MVVDGLRNLAAFLEGLQELSQTTGVTLDHYERIQIKVKDVAPLYITGAPDVSGAYGLEIREG